MTRSTRNILIALALGIGTGLFLGEKAAFLKFAADGYVRLLQMTVLPYIIVSVIAGFGTLDVKKARILFVRVGLLTIVLWGLALGLVFLLPLAFPTVQTASFFSSSLVEEPPALDFVSLYIPTNPFQSLANNIVPAVVLFSGFLGIALIGVEKKEPLLSGLQVLEKVLARANRFAVSLTPIGLFAIAGNTVGTIDLAQVSRLRVFIIGYGALSLLLVFWILPGLVACVTPIPAKRILHATRDALITAFMTGELFVVLAILLDRSRELLEEHGFAEPEEGAPADIIVPTFYNFPHVAKLLSLSFVLFAAWTSDTVVSAALRVQVALAGIVSLFGSMNSAMPFLLDMARVPSDTFQLFLATGILNSRFGTLAAAMHMVVLALAGSYAFTGKLRLSLPRILRYSVITVVATVITLAGIALLLRVTGQGRYDEDNVAMNMQFHRQPSRPAAILSELPKEPPLLPRAGASVLETVKARGLLRVGFINGALPYSFVNGRGDLVGFDVEMAYTLAAELGVPLEFVPVSNDNMADVLEAGQCDLVMSGVVLTTERANQMTFSSSYLDETLAFIVPDHRRADFSDAAWVRSTPGLRVAVPNIPYALALVQREFPGVTTVEINFEGVNDYFKGQGEPVDALVLTAERGSFRTLLYPAFSVAVPHPVVIKIPLAYPVARRDAEFAQFLGLWIDLKKKDDTIQSLYDHWILGRNAQLPRKRWSVVRNALHWVD